MLAVTVRHGFVRAWTMREASRTPNRLHGIAESEWCNIAHKNVQRNIKLCPPEAWSPEYWESNMFLMISSIVSSGICSQNLDEVGSNKTIPTNQNTDLYQVAVFSWPPIFPTKKKGCLGGVHPSCSHDFGSEMGLWNSSKTARVNWTSSHTMKFIHLSTPKSRRETPFKSQHLPWLEFGALVADSKLQVRLPPKHFDKAGANRNNNLGGPKPVNVSWRM